MLDGSPRVAVIVVALVNVSWTRPFALPSLVTLTPRWASNDLLVSTDVIVAVAVCGYDDPAPSEISPRWTDLIGDDGKELIAAPILLLRRCIPRYSDLG